jgi:hypothetical protein
VTGSQPFDLVREQPLPEVNSLARLYRHRGTGAELLSLVNDDENKVFGITLRTLPRDSTGVAHILEHSVLCGSRKYPVKDPFVQLMKGSLNTFLNAFTYPDKTCYPIASQNLRDFYNLVDVYLDAVFHPRLTRHTLEQEGWHYELESLDAPLAYKGVVLNEMKGNYSSPLSILSDWSRRSLFPDSVYGIDSGGDPRHIPELTYAAFKAFHRRYYHPSNSRLFFYGDDDPERRLALLDAYLREFDPAPIDRLERQPRFSAPRRLERSFAVTDLEPGAKAGLVTTSWMFEEPQDPEAALALGALNEILIGTPAAPLYKALIDSRLGSDIAGGGLDGELCQPMFSVGLKDIDVADAGKVEAVIIATLGALAQDGIDPLAVEAALNTIEFRLREQNTGSFPRGISMMLGALTTWLYGRDPLAPLAFEAPLAAIRARIAAGERYFEGLIARSLLENAHRTTLVLNPDPEQAERDLADEEARLAAARSAMSEAEVLATVENTLTLKRLQETPDPPETLATIPTLGLADLPRRNKFIPIEIAAAGATPILFHDLFTNNIVYLDLGLDIRLLPPELLPHTSLFARALLETGTGKEDFVRLSQRIGRTTGGIYPVQWTTIIRDSARTAAWLFLRGKAMAGKAPELLDILREVLLTARLDDRARFHQIVTEEKAALEHALVPSGSAFASLRLRASFNQADWADEQTRGISYLFFLRQLLGQIETDWPSIEAALARIRSILVNRAAMVCNVTTDAASWRDLGPRLQAFLDSLSASAAQPAQWPEPAAGPSEGITIPATVNYVAKGADLHRLGYRLTGATAVIRKYVSTTWLWEKVRVLGGAYGVHCSFNRYSGTFTFSSFRDPNLLATLDVYDRTAGFLKEAAVDRAELTRSIVGAIGDMDTYQLPDAKGLTSMMYHLVGETEESRQQLRDEVLAASPADFRDFADALSGLAQNGRVVVLGAEEAIAQANEARPGLLAVTKAL